MKINSIVNTQPALLSRQTQNITIPSINKPEKPELKQVDSSQALKNYFIASQNIKLPSFTGYPCSTSAFTVKQIENVPCPCCGKIMMNKDEKKEFVEKATQARGQALHDVLEENLHKFRRNEKTIARYIMNEAPNQPEASMAKILSSTKKTAQDFYIDECNFVLDSVDAKAKEFYGEKNKVSELITEEKNILNNPTENTFNRENFLKSLQKASAGDDNKTNQLLDIAIELPLEQQEIAKILYIFKGTNNSSGLASRLVATAAMTTEHIHPKSKGGPNHTANYMGECAECNNNRGHEDLNGYWEKYYPNMPANVQKYNDFITEKIIIGEMGDKYEDYPEDLEFAVKMETNGKIDLDILNPEEIDAARKERNLDDPQPLKNNEDQDLGTHKSKGKGKHKGKKHVYVRS